MGQCHWCYEQSMWGLFDAGPAPEICISPWLFPQDSRPSLHSAPTDTYPAAMWVSEGWSPQNTRYLCKFSLSASGPRTVVGGRWRSRSSRPWIYQQKQSCGRREWLGGLSPNGRFANLNGGLLKVYVGRLSLGYAPFLWPRGFVLGKPERLVWGSRPGTFLGTRLHPVGLLDSPLHLPGRQAACTERDWSCDGKSLRSCDPVVRGECSSPGSWSHSCRDWVGGLGRLPEELCHPRPFADGYLNWWRPVAHGKGAQKHKICQDVDWKVVR